MRINKTTILALLLTLSTSLLFGQSDCEITLEQGQGYSTSISSVADNGDGSYTIVLVVENNGCPGPECKKLNHFSVEADSGTYSDISVEVISGAFTYANINYGPDLGGDPFDGFRINNANGMGNGQPASFSITYTLTGGLQDQQVLAKAGSDDLIVEFTADDFQAYLDCANRNIFPYYQPPDGGKVYDLIGAELTSLHYVFIANGSYFSDDIFQIVGSSVLIDIVPLDGKLDSVFTLLSTPAYGLTSAVSDPGLNVIHGLYPIGNLLLLNALPNLINFARPVFTALGNAGIVTSQGDTSLRGFYARNGFNLSGAGVKIGVLSDSYNTLLGNQAADDVLRGDLPGVDNPRNTNPVEVLKDYPYGPRSDEGRAMLQIIHDVAPGAELAFRTGFLGAADFSRGIIELQQAGCDIIVDDITYINEPFFRDGIIAAAVDSVTSLGVAYFSAAGNYGSRSYQSDFYPVAAPEGVTGEAHNFAGATGGNDIYQGISLTAGNYTVVLQWDDGTPGKYTSSDFDIYLSEEDGNFLFGFNRDNTGGAPVEVLPFTVTGDSAQTNFLIVRESGSGPALLKYIVFRGIIGTNEYATPDASTLVGQANAEGAIAVGAVLYSNTPEYGVYPPTVASFSSRGGTPVDGILRAKPDISGPNGVNTTVDLGGVNIDGDAFPNFFGTSAAAPHAAAVAALVQQARDKFYDASLSPAEIRNVLQNSAIDMYTPGNDIFSGAGFIQADAALLTMANPAPNITGIYYDTTLTPGVDPIVITVFGEYLTDESQIYFNGSPLINATILLGDTAVSSTIPVFSDRYPPIQVYNPPMAGTNGTDGGLSDPLYFTTKETIVVNIDDKTKKYGEVLPAFTAVYAVESVNGSIPLDSAGLTQAEIDRIHSVALTTVANPLSNVGLWAIEPDNNDPLNPLSNVTATDPLDISLLERYNFDFINGLLEIEKLDLVISPRDTTFTYGDIVGGLNFDYDFNLDPDDLIVIDDSDSLAILSAVKLGFATALVNETVLVDATALVNELGEPLLDASTLLNKSFMISNAMSLKFATALVNGSLIQANALYAATALVNGVTLQNNTALAPATALVNGDVIVNAYDSTGNLNAIQLGFATALVNAAATALVNTTTINANSNSDAIVILGEGDIKILSGDSTGTVDLRSINLITGNTVGQHLIVPGSFISNNFNLSYGLGTLTIVPDTAEIVFDASSLDQTYDATPKTVSVSTVPEGLTVELTYDGNASGPVNAGTYVVSAVIDDPNYVGEATTTLVINPATATVTAGTNVIKAGDPLPVFTATFSGFLGSDDESVVESLTFSVSPAYSGSAGTYQIIPAATADNYAFTPVNGTLYVNPFGPGTKQVKTFLDCVEELNPPDSNGFTYIAHFRFENDNSTDIYIPIGPDNLLSGQASFNGINQPELFVSGGGTFTVPFNGNKLIWEVYSYKGNGNKSAAGSQASSTSNRCNKSAEAELPPAMAGEEGSGLNLYPNPTTGKVFIELNGEMITFDDIQVFDIFGKTCPLQVRRSSDYLLEIDLAGYTSGIYLVRIKTSDSIKVIRIIKT